MVSQPSEGRARLDSVGTDYCFTISLHTLLHIYKYMYLLSHISPYSTTHIQVHVPAFPYLSILYYTYTSTCTCFPISLHILLHIYKYMYLLSHISPYFTTHMQVHVPAFPYLSILYYTYTSTCTCFPISLHTLLHIYKYMYLLSHISPYFTTHIQVHVPAFPYLSILYYTYTSTCTCFPISLYTLLHIYKYMYLLFHIQFKPDISQSCISRNWIYRGRMLDPIFCPPISRILQTRRPYFSRNRGNSLHLIRGIQFFAKSAHRDSLCSCSLETIFREINSSLSVNAGWNTCCAMGSHTRQSIDTSIVSQSRVQLIQCQCKSGLQTANLGINNDFNQIVAV